MLQLLFYASRFFGLNALTKWLDLSNQKWSEAKLLK